MRKTVGGDALWLPIPDSGIVDHRVKVTHRVDLRRDILGAYYRVEVADNKGLCILKFFP
jgi:hypothetical protein